MKCLSELINAYARFRNLIIPVCHFLQENTVMCVVCEREMHRAGSKNFEEIFFIFSERFYENVIFHPFIRNKFSIMEVCAGES